jgi:hypothetical protein
VIVYTILVNGERSSDINFFKVGIAYEDMNFRPILLRVKEQRNILHEIRKRKGNWIGHILRRNCLLQWVTEGKIQGRIEMTERQGRRRRKLLDDLKEREDTLI